MERMSTLDAGFYFVEHENVPMHIGTLTVFEGPAPSYDDLLALYSAKLAAVPRYRQVVRTTPGGVFRPYWADDPEFEIGYHLRHSAVPPPGGPAQLMAMAARVLAQKLDRARPLWEAWFLEGLDGGRWAIISKVHHCMVDGIGGSDLMAALFDVGPDGEPPRPVPWTPDRGPSMATVIASGILDDVVAPVRQLVSLPGLVRRRLGSAGQALSYGAGLARAAGRLTARSARSLNGPIGPHRRWAWTTASLTEVKAIKNGLGGTVNDVVLAAITAGFRDLLAERGELRPGLVVRSLIPVSLRGADDRELASNKLSAMLANLPVGEDDPVRRLELLHDQMADLKATRQAVGPEIVTDLVGLAAAPVLARGARAAFRLPQPLVQTITTNVPGPGFPLYLLGRKMVQAYPYVPIADRLLLGVAIFSYLDTFYFGITAEYRQISPADLRTFIDGINRGIADLSAEVPAAARGRPRRGGSGRGRPTG